MRYFLYYKLNCFEEKIMRITFHQCREPFDQYFNAGCIRDGASQWNLINFKTTRTDELVISGIS